MRARLQQLEDEKKKMEEHTVGSKGCHFPLQLCIQGT